MSNLVETLGRWAAIEPRAPRTLQAYRYSLLRLSRAGISRLADVTIAKVAAFVEARVVETSVDSVQQELAALCSVLRFLVSREEAPRKVLDRVRRLRPRSKAVRALGARFLTRAEYERLRDAAEGRTRLVVVLGALSGLRAGELARLRWENVDLARRVIYVRLDPALGAEGRIKTMHERVVPICEELGRELAAVARRGAFVFAPTESRTTRPHVTFLRLREGLAWARSLAGIPDATFHVLRHTRASWWVQAGVPIAKAAKWIGNTPEVLARHYAGIADGFDADADRVPWAAGTLGGAP